jgi:hypothetical protein
MKSLITAIALTAVAASPCLALPSNGSAARHNAALDQQSFAQVAQLRRGPRLVPNINSPMRKRDPDPFIQNYLRNDPPGSQWGDTG